MCASQGAAVRTGRTRFGIRWGRPMAISLISTKLPWPAASTNVRS